MTVEKVTISLPPDVAAAARVAVNNGEAESLSAYVATALRERQARAHGLAELERVLGGRPPQEAIDAVHRAWGITPSPPDDTDPAAGAA
jgi:antitoxin ParD1/3/4